MPESMIEHANATLEIVDLLQAMVGDCKCEAKHLWHYPNRPSEPMETPCEITVSYRYRHRCSGQDKLVCDAFNRDYVRKEAQGIIGARCCAGLGISLIPV
jgi:hypothetical protein